MLLVVAYCHCWHFTYFLKFDSIKDQVSNKSATNNLFGLLVNSLFGDAFLKFRYLGLMALRHLTADRVLGRLGLGLLGLDHVVAQSHVVPPPLLGQRHPPGDDHDEGLAVVHENSGEEGKDNATPHLSVSSLTGLPQRMMQLQMSRMTMGTAAKTIQNKTTMMMPKTFTTPGQSPGPDRQREMTPLLKILPRILMPQTHLATRPLCPRS